MSLLEHVLKDFELFLERILDTFSKLSPENREMRENVILSTALRRDANSRGCRGIKIEDKSS